MLELKLEHFSALLPTQIGMIGVVGNIVNHFYVLRQNPETFSALSATTQNKYHNTG
jgi:hypothetical protein